jgi:hypothetical protein
VRTVHGVEMGDAHPLLSPVDSLIPAVSGFRAEPSTRSYASVIQITTVPVLVIRQNNPRLVDRVATRTRVYVAHLSR